jgi:glycosyltransferase involved in cell wall biosynthesis
MIDVNPPFPDVSVVIPCCNAERFIVQALESVQAQTVPVAEIVIVNDGSTDHSAERIEAFAAQMSSGKLRLFSQPNHGVDDARTRAIELASNDLVITLDADDMLHPQAVERLLAHAAANPEHALIYGDYYLMDVDGRVTGEVCHRKRRSDPLEGQILATMLWENVTGAVNLIRREAVLSVGGYRMDRSLFDSYKWHDVMLNFRLLVNGYTFGYLPHATYYYRDTPGSLSKDTALLARAKQQIHAWLFAQYPEQMAEAFLAMQQWRAEQLRDAFLTLEARDQQIASLLSEIDIAREYQARLEAALKRGG